MNLRFLGHSSFEIIIEKSKTTLLTDPFISPNELASEIDIADLHPQYILVSHGHEDHVADAEVIAKQSNATIVSNFEIVNWFASKGVKNGHPMNIGGKWNFPFGTVKSVNAVHSSVMPDGAYGGNPGGFIIDDGAHKIYFAGDTALTKDMELLSDLNLDLAILPIGDNFTMGIDDAVLAAKLVNVKNVIGMHYDTFGYIKIDHQLAIDSFSKAGIDLTLLKIGETYTL